MGVGKQINRLKEEVASAEMEFDSLKLQVEAQERENHRMREVLLAKVNARIAREEGRPEGEGGAAGGEGEPLDATTNSVLFN